MSTYKRDSPTKHAVEDFLLLLDILSAMQESCSNTYEELSKNLRTRTRSTPSQLLDWGLPVTLTFLLSKSNVDMLDRIVGRLDAGDKQEITKILCGENGKPPSTLDSSYSLYMAFIERELRRLSASSNRGDYEENASQRLLRVIRDTLDAENPARYRPLRQGLLSYTIQFKRLAEAYLEEEGGGGS